jgi:tetratricopeptide (TPR) repeat protein
MTRCLRSNRTYRMLATTVGLMAASVIGAYIAGVGPFASSRLERARRDIALGNSSSAIKLYLAHLDAEPTDYAARLELGELLKPTDASYSLTLLQEIPAEAAEYSQAIWHIAHIASAGKQDALAEDALLKLDELRPNDAGVSLSLAELYYRTDRFTEALPFAKRATQIQSSRAQSWLLLAEVLDNLNRPGEMLQPLQEAVKLDADLYAAHANLAYALYVSGRLNEAEAEALWCLKRNPNDIDVRRWLAMTLRDRGDHDAAFQQVNLALAKSPGDVDCHIVAADLLLFRRDAQQAYDSLKPLYAEHADRRDFLGSLARAAAMSGRREESRRYQQEIVQLMEQESAPN